MGPVNHVAVVNRSRGLVPDGVLAAIVEAYRAELAAFCTAWSVPIPGLALYSSLHVQIPEEEACIFVVDSGGDPGAFGAHTQLGKYVWGYVDAGLALATGEPVSRVVGHELFELIVDPGLDRWADAGGGERVAVEVCDATQRQSRREMASFFGHSSIVELANYCLPSFFRTGAGGPYDWLNLLDAPFAVAPGGYLVRRAAGAAFVNGAGRVTSYGRTFRRLASAGR